MAAPRLIGWERSRVEGRAINDGSDLVVGVLRGQDLHLGYLSGRHDLLGLESDFNTDELINCWTSVMAPQNLNLIQERSRTGGSQNAEP